MNTNLETILSERSAFDALRRFAPRSNEGERCELCSLTIGEAHQHLLKRAGRKITCACDACAVLFSDNQTGKYERIPRTSRLLADFRLNDLEWESLTIPIGLAFFFHNSSTARVAAYYPSPGGATECLLDLSAWTEIEDANPLLREIKPDVEALLVNRIGKTREYYLAPIDKCFELVGLIRTNWQGFTGGQDLWTRIEEFFQQLRREARCL